MSRILRAAAAVVALALSSQAPAATHGERIDALLRSYNEHRQFNGAALVAEKGAVILRKGYGMANMECAIPNTPDTRFRIGSLTKQFTAMVILQLVSERKVGLDEKITRYLPDYRKDTGDKVTIRHLLAHTSGIPSYTDQPGWPAETRNPHAVADFVRRYASGDLEFEPGTRFHYDNSGYYLLGAIIERVTGLAYEEAVRARIFSPLGMTGSGYDHAEIVLPRRASGYVLTTNGYLNAPYVDMSNPYAAGALYSTVDDLYKWDRALYTEKLLGNELKKAMWTPVLNDYAFAWMVRTRKLDDGKTEVPILVHNGAINGFAALFVRMPQTQDLVVLLDNTARGNIQSALANGIIDVLHGIDPPPPKESIANELAKVLQTSGAPAAVARHRELKANEPRNWDFGEDELNDLGYRLLQARKVEDAIAIFRLNAEDHPKSFNAYDSLADGYEAHGDHDLAIENYKKSLELNPRNTHAAEEITRLQQARAPPASR